MSYKKYYIYKEQYSEDYGRTWKDTEPLITSPSGDPIGEYSTLEECGSTPPECCKGILRYSDGTVRSMNCDSTAEITSDDVPNSYYITSVEIGDCVKYIEQCAFRGWGLVTSIGPIGSGAMVEIPDSLIRIGTWAFANCENLTDIRFPDSYVTNITYDQQQFNGCTSLTGITFNNLRDISYGMFSGCTSLTSIGPVGSGAMVEMPDTVTSIGSRAFSDCTGLTSVTIPNSVTSIGSEAFWRCSSLKTFITHNASIGAQTCYECNNLETVVIDGATSIPLSSFEGCTSLTSVTIGNSVTSIGWRAFAMCTSLTSVVIPDSVTSIDGSAFWGCTSLTSVTIGSGVTTIGDDAFSNTAIEVLEFPELVQGIPSLSIPSLESLTVGGGIRYLHCLSGCTSLSELTIPGTCLQSLAGYSVLSPSVNKLVLDTTIPPYINPEHTFDGFTGYVYVHNPSVYQNDSEWRQYANIIRPIP